MSKIFSNALFEAKERESAVSPVVGVMLMLVVTIIIAATVSAFAGGLVGTADKTPQAAFDVQISTSLKDWSVPPHVEPIMAITHLGGDPIDTARVKLVTTWTNRTTNEVYYRETTALPASSTPELYNSWSSLYTNTSLENVNVDNGNVKYQEPYFVIPGEWPGSDTSLWFGNFILHPGEVMKVQGSLSTYSDYNPDAYAEHSVIKNAEMLTGRDSVNVKLIDIPTGNVILDKDVYVTEG